MMRFPAFAAVARLRARAARGRPDQMGHADGLSRQQLPHREHPAVRQRRRQGHRRQAQDHRARRTHRCSRRRRSSAPCRAARRRSARSCWSTSKTRIRSTGSTAFRSSRPSYGDAMKLYKASKKTLEDKFAKQGMKLLYTVAWPPQGIYTKRTLASVADMKGLKMACLQPGHVEDRRARRRAAGHRPGRRGLAGARHRRRSTPTCRPARPASTRRPTSTSRTSTTRRPGCRRTRSSSTRRRSTRSTSPRRPRC